MPNNTSDAGMASLMGTMIILALVLALSWFALRWLTRRMPTQMGSRHIKLLDRIAVAPDKCLLLVRVAEKTMLVGMTSHAVEKLCDVEDPDHTLETAEAPGSPMEGFKEVFAIRMGWKKEGSQ